VVPHHPADVLIPEADLSAAISLLTIRTLKILHLAI